MHSTGGEVCIVKMDMEEDVSRVCRRYENEDEVRRNAEEEVEDDGTSVLYRDKIEDGKRTLGKDEEEYEWEKLNTGEKRDYGGLLRDGEEEELNTLRTYGEEEEPKRRKGGEREDEESMSRTGEKEDEARSPRTDEEKEGQSMVGSYGEDYERKSPVTGESEGEWSASRRDEEKDEQNILESLEKEGERYMLREYEKEDDLNTLRRDETENEWYSVNADAKEDENSDLKTNGKKDEWDGLKRDEKEDEFGKSKSAVKENRWDSLEQYEKVDALDVLERVKKEHERMVLWRDEKEEELGFPSRDKEENDPGSPKGDGKENGPNSLRREIEEESRQMPESRTMGNELSELKRDGREVNPNVSNGHEKEDGKADGPSLIVRGKDDELESLSSNTKVDDGSVKKTDLQEETGWQDQSSSILEAVRVAGEAFQNMYFTGPILPQSPAPRHRRTQSEIGTPGHRRTNSFQRLKMQMQKAWRGVSNLREDTRPSFNPEVMANQKRQWYQLHSSKALDQTKYKEPTSLFEHFIIVGLHPETNLEAVEEAFAKRKKWEMEMLRSEMADYRILHYRGPQVPTLEPEILFKYPPGKKLAMRPKDLATFCFPGGVKSYQLQLKSIYMGLTPLLQENVSGAIGWLARLLERTPSLSDLNELVYGQEHLGTDDSSYIFSLKVADDATLYGVCLHVSEIVQRPPGVLSTSSPLHSSGGGSHFLVSAPRCYCLLTRVPFFELHFEMLNSMIAQERLKRITEFVSEMSLAASVGAPSVSRLNDQINGNFDSPVRDCDDWMASAIPVDSAITLTAAAAGFISDDDITFSSQKILEPRSPDSVVTSDTSDVSQVKEIDRDGRKGSQCYDDNASEVSENRLDARERMCRSYENGQASPEVMFADCRNRPVERIESSESVFSSARSVLSDEVDDTHLSTSENDFGDDLIMEWARDHKNDSLQIVCGYHSMALPSRGSEIVFQPLEHLQAIEYIRPSVSALGLSEEYLDSCDTSGVNARLAAAEEALALSTWTTATICRVLSLETILALLAGILLEKQEVLICPNLGVLSATVLSLIPMIRPFQWQSLLLPVLPGRMFDFLDAPVPFLVGIQSKPADWKIKTSNLIQVNILSDQLKTCHLPALPRRRELMAQLSPIHARLAYQSSVARRHPVYRCTEVQAEAATKFLTVMRQYMESLCSDLRSHTITSIQSNSDRVCLLLKDSFIDSFPGRDRPFIKLFVDTQLFSVLSDSRLSSFENGRL